MKRGLERKMKPTPWKEAIDADRKQRWANCWERVTDRHWDLRGGDGLLVATVERVTAATPWSLARDYWIVIPRGSLDGTINTREFPECREPAKREAEDLLP